MIEKETVLVLGAGASKPYGFPTGPELIDWIANKSVPDDTVILNTSAHQLKVFRQLLKKSDPQSIDEFLEHHPDHIDLGKRLIAYHIMTCERPEELYTRQPGNWYRHFFHTAFERHFEWFGKNRLSVITFNYDRSFEEYMYQTLTSHFSLYPLNPIIEAIKGVRVIHVYGSIGPLIWQTSDPNGYRHYVANQINQTEIDRAAKQLTVIPEGKDDTPVLEQCHRLLDEAERIFFLGFGYLEDNMRRLRCPRGNVEMSAVDRTKNIAFKAVRDVCGTGLGITEAEYDYLKRKNDFPVNIPDLSWDIYAFIRNCQQFVFHER